MNFDEIDLKILQENFDNETIKEIDIDNVGQIFKYLGDNGIYYAKDLFLSSFNLFLLPAQQFIIKFEKLKSKIGDNYIDRLGEDSSLIEFMYED